MDDNEINTIVHGPKKVELIEQSKNKLIIGFVFKKYFTACLYFAWFLTIPFPVYNSQI